MRVSRAREVVRRVLDLDLELVDPSTGLPYHGNTKISSIRAQLGSEETPGRARYRAARSDARLGSVEQAANEAFGFNGPVIQALNADGRNTRSDKRVGKYRKDSTR